MLLKAVVDETTPLSPKDERFASILQFVADEFDRAFFYLFKDWTDRVIVGENTKDFKPEQPRLVYFSKIEIAANNGWESEKGKVPVHIPSNELVYSNNYVACRAALEQQGLNATTALLTLAAAGVDIALPNVSFARSPDDVAEIRRKLETERINYLGAVSHLADESFGRLSSGDFHDIYNWARNEATLRILPRARQLQLQLRKLDRSLLERAGTQFWQDGVPAIGKALINSGKEGAIKTIAEETIRVLAGTLAKRIEERKIPEAAYTLKLSAELEKL